MARGTPAALTAPQKRHIGALLRQRERELYADMNRERDKSEGFRRHASEVPDAGDASLADLITGLDEAEVGRDLAELRAVGEALQRLPGEDYGYCVRCGTPIPYERLKAQPATQRCTECQALYEKHYAGKGPGPKL